MDGFSLHYNKSDAVALVRAVKAYRFGPYHRILRRAVQVLLGIWLFRAGITGLVLPYDGLVLDDIASYGSVIIPGLILFILGLYLLFSGMANRAPLAERRALKSFPKQGEHNCYRFEEDYYELSLDGTLHRMPYSSLNAVIEDSGHYYLLTDANAAHTLGKRNFMTGGAEYFRTFISSKTGFTIKPV